MRELARHQPRLKELPMRSEREKITGKVAAATLRLNANRYELPPDEDTCLSLIHI